ncbi:MAG TPA: lamin tail domain-containing protein [Candidatus Saccharimonadales bacterium]|nr:lamin tail domain-containing protein [Candidatus Saccharimonadales bacterium]
MKFRFVIAISILFVSFGVFILLFSTHIAQAAAAQIVISEIQLAGGTTNDEFIELYNPTGNAVSLANWHLKKKTSSGTETDLIATMSGTIAPHGYFLIARPEYDGTVTPDLTYSGNVIANDNTILLYTNLSVIVDKVGFGSAIDKETTTITNPTASHSAERKANSTSTILSMTTGADVLAGNGEDTDNNSTDFIIRVVSDPQNSNSAVEPVLLTPTSSTSSGPTAPSPTVTPTDTPSATPTTTPTPTVTPTVTFTVTPTVTVAPTVTLSPTSTETPTVTPSPTFTVTPTPTPSTGSGSSTPTPIPSTPTSIPSTPTPTITPIVTVIPTVSPIVTFTVTPTPIEHHLPFHFVWSWKFRVINIHGHRFTIPYFHCERKF